MAVEVANDESFESLLGKHERVVVKYYAGWCGSCRLFEPKFKRLSEDARFRGVAFLDVNAEESPKARKMAGVQNLPFFAVFKNGKLVEGSPTNQEELVVKMIKKIQA